MPEFSDTAKLWYGGEEVTVFIDGLGDDVTYPRLKKEAVWYGKVLGVYLQRQRSEGRQARFGFVRFKYREDGVKAIKGWNGVSLWGRRLIANEARYDRNRRQIAKTSRPAKQKQVWRVKETQSVKEGAMKKQVKKVWRVKQQKVESLSYWSRKGFWCTSENSMSVDNLARATTSEVYTISMLQDFLDRNGLAMIEVKPLGETEVILQFESSTEMEAILEGARDFLLERFTIVEPCSERTCSGRQPLRVRILKTPLYARGVDFFEAVVASFGRLVCLDNPIIKRERFDIAKVLVDVEEPLKGGFETSMQVNGVTHNLVVIPEHDVVTSIRARPGPGQGRGSSTTTDSESEADLEDGGADFDDDDEEEHEGGDGGEIDGGDGGLSGDDGAGGDVAVEEEAAVTFTTSNQDSHYGIDSPHITLIQENVEHQQALDLLECGYDTTKIKTTHGFQNLNL